MGEEEDEEEEKVERHNDENGRVWVLVQRENGKK